MLEELGGIRVHGKSVEVFVSFEYHWKTFYRSFFFELEDVLEESPSNVIRELIQKGLVEELDFWSDYKTGEVTKIYYLAMIDDEEIYSSGMFVIGGGADLVPFFIDVFKINELYQKMFNSDDVLFLVKSSKIG